MPSRCAVNLWTVGCADPCLTARARSATAHKLHSTQQQHRMNLISGNDQTSSRLPVFSLSLPGTCPNNRDRRSRALMLDDLEAIHNTLTKALKALHLLSGIDLDAITEEVTKASSSGEIAPLD